MVCSGQYKENLKILDDRPSADREKGAFYDLQMARVYEREVDRPRPLSWIYRAAPRRRIDSTIVNSRFTPGPHGVRGIEQLKEREFSDGIKNLEIEIERLTRGYASKYQTLIFQYMYICTK
jgi:hypothetical protein